MARLHGALRSLLWVASSREDYAAFPPAVQETVGFELLLVQSGQSPPSAKTLTGIGTGAFEIMENFDGDAYRSVYTVRFRSAVYVLHCFRNRSKRSAGTALSDIELVRRRLRDAAADHASRHKGD